MTSQTPGASHSPSIRHEMGTLVPGIHAAERAGAYSARSSRARCTSASPSASVRGWPSSSRTSRAKQLAWSRPPMKMTSRTNARAAPSVAYAWTRPPVSRRRSSNTPLGGWCTVRASATHRRGAERARQVVGVAPDERAAPLPRVLSDTTTTAGTIADTRGRARCRRRSHRCRAGGEFRGAARARHRACRLVHPAPCCPAACPSRLRMAAVSARASAPVLTVALGGCRGIWPRSGPRSDADSAESS